MAHFSEIGNENIVARVLVIPNEQEHRGEDFIKNELGIDGRWIRTSFNTFGGIHYDQETGLPSENQEKSLRKNYGAVGFFYDEEKDAFIPPRPPEGTWILNEETCLWERPIPMPETGGPWIWNEEIGDWQEVNL